MRRYLKSRVVLVSKSNRDKLALEGDITDYIMIIHLELKWILPSSRDSVQSSRFPDNCICKRF